MVSTAGILDLEVGMKYTSNSIFHFEFWNVTDCMWDDKCTGPVQSNNWSTIVRRKNGSRISRSTSLSSFLQQNRSPHVLHNVFALILV